MKTVDGVSPSVSTSWIWISFSVFVVLYVILGVVNVVLMLRYARRDFGKADSPEPEAEEPELVY